MNMSLEVHRLRVRRQALLAVATSLSLQSCRSSAPYHPAGDYQGELRVPIEHLGVEVFEEIVKHADWSNGHDVDRDCSDASCVPNTGGTRVRIRAIGDAWKISRLAPPGAGVLVARMRNDGDGRESVYGIPPGKDWWYLLWDRNASGTPRWRLVRHHAPFLGHHEISFPSYGEPIKDCGDAHVYTVSDADFKDCPPPLGAVTIAMAAARARAWVTCSQGCCTADY
jgi:hypothetical protein